MKECAARRNIEQIGFDIDLLELLAPREDRRGKFVCEALKRTAASGMLYPRPLKKPS